MTRLSQHGDFPQKAIDEAKAALSADLDFAEAQEPLARNKAGYPSFGDFVEAHFDFRDGQSYPAPFSSEEVRRLRDELGIVRSEVAKGYEGAAEKAQQIRAKLTDAVRQNYTNLQAAYAGTDENQPVIDARGLLIAEEEGDEPKIGKEMNAAYQKYQTEAYKQATYGSGFLPQK